MLELEDMDSVERGRELKMDYIEIPMYKET
jgi:hypothetical protein